jgi:hypothetical protein
MATALTDTQREQLARMVTKAGMAPVVFALAEITREHGAAWERTAKALEKCAAMPAIATR